MKSQFGTVMQRGVEGGRGWIRENWQNTVVDVNSLSRQLRWLTIFGYGAVLFFVAAFILFEFVGDALPRLYFPVDGLSADDVIEMGYTSYGALALFSLTTVLGWGLLLTGASDCRRRVFIPVFAFYMIVLMLTSFWGEGREDGSGAAFQCLDILLLIFAFGFGVAVAITRRLAFWSRYPLIEFVGWSGLTALHMLLSWGSAESQVAIGNGFVIMAGMLAVVALPFWFLLGMDAAAAINEYAYFATHRVQAVLAPRTFRWLVPIFVLAELIAGFLLVGNDNDNGIGIVVCAPLLLLAILVLAVARRWTMKAAAITFWSAMVALLFGVFYALAVQGADVNEVLLESTRVLPPALVFTVLLLYDVMTFGTRAASTDGRIMPRSGRLLMYLGVVVLTAGFTIFIFNLVNAETGEPAGGFQKFANDATFLGLFFLGPLYLLRTLWKSRDDLVIPPYRTAAETTVEAAPGSGTATSDPL